MIDINGFNKKTKIYQWVDRTIIDGRLSFRTNAVLLLKLAYDLNMYETIINDSDLYKYASLIGGNPNQIKIEIMRTNLTQR